jgi:hypothetical protein
MKVQLISRSSDILLLAPHQPGSSPWKNKAQTRHRKKTKREEIRAWERKANPVFST